MTDANKNYVLVKLTARDYDEREVDAFVVATTAYVNRTRAAIRQLDEAGISLDIGIHGNVEWESAEEFLADVTCRELTAEEVASMMLIFPIKDKTDEVVAGFGHYRFLEKVRENLGIGY